MFNFALTNIGNLDRTIYIWHRIGRELKLFKDTSFFPYYYQSSSKGTFRTINGELVSKIICRHPGEISKKRDLNSWESDLNYCKRYIIDKIDQVLPCELKYSFLDIEVTCPELPTKENPIYPISCISMSNSYTNEIKTFFLEDYNVLFVGNMEMAEKKLLDDFNVFIKKEQFDLLLGWNMQFDWGYLRARYQKLFGVELAEVLSSINQVRFENEDNQVPVDISIVDYLEWTKKVYKGESSYALDSIAQKHLGETANEKVDFSVLSLKIKEKNINDVRRLVELEKKFKLIEYYDNLRRMGKAVFFSDLTWNSKIIDAMLLTEAKKRNIILPSKKYKQDGEIEIEEVGFEGAYRRGETGRFENAFCLDLSSAYPQMIINFCLDLGNIRENEGLDVNGVRFSQDSSALLPTLAKKLINQKNNINKQLKESNSDSNEHKDLQIKYDSTKSIVNSVFGITGL